MALTETTNPTISTICADINGQLCYILLYGMVCLVIKVIDFHGMIPSFNHVFNSLFDNFQRSRSSGSESSLDIHFGDSPQYIVTFNCSSNHIESETTRFSYIDTPLQSAVNINRPGSAFQIVSSCL